MRSQRARRIRFSISVALDSQGLIWQLTTVNKTSLIYCYLLGPWNVDPPSILFCRSSLLLNKNFIFIFIIFFSNLGCCFFIKTVWISTSAEEQFDNLSKRFTEDFVTFLYMYSLEHFFPVSINSLQYTHCLLHDLFQYI